jgi:hypothetical protein
MDPTATPSARNTISTDGSQATASANPTDGPQTAPDPSLSSSSRHAPSASFHGTLPSRRRPSLIPTPFPLPLSSPPPSTPVSRGRRIQGEKEKRGSKPRSNFAHSTPTKVQQGPRAPLDSNHDTFKPKRTNLRPRNGTPISHSSTNRSSGRHTPSSCHTLYNSSTGTSQSHRNQANLPAITTETVLEHISGRSLSNFLNGADEQPVAVLKQFLQRVVGNSMTSHLDEHLTGNVADQSLAFG